MLSKWFNTAKDEQIHTDLPQNKNHHELSDVFQSASSHIHYYFSVFNGTILTNEALYHADDFNDDDFTDDLTDWIHQHALVSEHLGEIADAVFQLLESDPNLNVIYQQADYDSPLRQHLQIAGLYHTAAVKHIVAAFQQTHLPLAIAHFTDDTVLADELLVVLSKIQRVFEFAETENKIVISYLA